MGAHDVLDTFDVMNHDVVDPGRARRGTTLLELVIVLALFATITVGFWSVAGAARDRVAVSAAHFAFAQTIREARRNARAFGGTRVVVDMDSARVSVVRTGRPDRILSFGHNFGVTISGRGTRTPTLRFDPAGLGRFTSRTFTLGRGGATRTVVVSAYGRVDRR